MAALACAAAVHADTGVTMYDQNTTNYVQLHSSSSMRTSYRVVMPATPGTVNQVLGILGVSGSVINTQFVNQSGGGGGGSGIVSPGTFTWQNTFGISVSTIVVTSSITINGPMIANGSVGNLGQVLASQGNNLPPVFIDPIVSQAYAPNLNANVSINPSSNTVYVVNPATVTVSNMFAGTTFYLVNPATVTVSNMFAGTTSYIVNPTTASLYITNNAGTGLAGVGYQTNGASIPVNVLNTVAVTGSFSASSVNITTATPNTALPTALQFVGGVGPTGLAQSFAVDASSNMKVTGSFSATSVNITTVAYNASFPGQGSTLAHLGPTGLAQADRVDLSSALVVNITTGVALTVNTHAVTLSQPNVVGATITFNGAQPISVLYQPTVLGATVTYNGTQQVTVGTLYQPTVIGATVTFNGTQNVQLQTGANVIGTVVISSANGVNGSTIAVTNAGGVALKVDGSAVTQPVSGTLTISTGGVTAAQGPAGAAGWRIDLSTGVRVNTIGGANLGIDLSTGVRVNTTGGPNLGVDLSTGVQVNTGTRFLGVDFSTGVLVTGSTVTIQAPNNNTTPIPVTGSFSASSVNITTATPNTALPTAGVMIGGVGPTGLFQSFAVTASSALNISGTINATAVQLSTGQINTTPPGNATLIGAIGPTGLLQGFAVDVSSQLKVTGSFSASSVQLSTAQVNTAPPGNATLISGMGPTGLVQTFVVDISSHIIVNVSTGGVTSAEAVQSAAGVLTPVGWQVNGASVPVATVNTGSVTFFNTMVTTNSVVVSSNIFGFAQISFTLFPGSSPVSGKLNNVVFEMSPDFGTTWLPVVAYQKGSEVYSSSYSIVGGATTSWTTDTYGDTNFRLRMANFQSGIPAATLTPIISVNDRAITSNLAVQISSNGTTMPLAVGYQTNGASVPVSVLNNLNIGVLYQPTVIGATVTYNGTQTVNVATGGVTAAQGPAGTSDWRVTWSTAGALSNNGAAATGNRIGVLPSIFQTNYQNGSAGTNTNNAALSQGTDGLLWTASLPAIRPASFSASTNSITAAAGATYVACLRGNASDTVLLYSMRASCTQTTAGNIVLEVVKSTIAFTGSWSTMTVTPDDSSINTGVQISSAVFFNNTVATTLMNTNFFIDTYSLGCMATGTTSPNDIYISPASWRVKPKVLRGVAESVCVSMDKRTVTGGLFNVGFDWIETSTISP